MSVKVRRALSGTGYTVTQITIPKEIADDLEAAHVEEFDVEVTDEGVLLRPIVAGAPRAPRPQWLRPPGASDEGPSNARRATRTDAARAASA